MFFTDSLLLSVTLVSGLPGGKKEQLSVSEGFEDI